VQDGRTDLVVGFDLDMTLLDSRPGIAATYDALARRTGVPIDSALAVTRLGPPVQQELAHWFPAEEVDDAARRYLALYPDHAIEPSTPMPGAEEALAAVRRHGGRSVVVTAKHAPNAELHMKHLGLDVDEVVGDLWGGGKGPALTAHDATVYVGDHVLDVDGARVAGAVSVAVSTGPCSEEQLAAAGADVVLADLGEFPRWLDEHLFEARPANLDTRPHE
jgi:phosphoglycolate phosphatase